VIRLESPEWQPTMDRIYSTFTPSAPVSNTELFSGRREQIENLERVIAGKGQHAVMYGERGVGKTSVATWCVVVHRSDRVVLKVNCDTTDNFSSIWAKALGRLDPPRRGPARAARQDLEEIALETENRADGFFTPDDVRFLAEQVEGVTGQGAVFFFDEFDRLEDVNVRPLMTDTLKTLSDEEMASTIILMGVADTVQELVEEHDSVQRALVQIRMPRMTTEELCDILKAGFARIEMEIDPPSAQAIATMSQGFPHYTHLLGQAAAHNALTDQRALVVRTDVEAAIATALSSAQYTLSSLYDKATGSANQNALYSEVLLACALTVPDDLGYFSPRDVQPTLAKLLGQDIGLARLTMYMTQLATEKRGPTLIQRGRPRAWRFRFNDPMMQPFSVLKGVDQKRISLHRLEDGKTT
jgi:hypothetical protein